jgi:aminobenzoyl-glutamate utilization protein B
MMHLRVLLAGLIVALATARTAAQPVRDDSTDRMIAAIDARFEAYDRLQKRIWGFAEVGFQEKESSAALRAALAEAGFDIREGIADEPTAFLASFGSGKPVVAVLAEYDALPGLSQAAVPERKPLVEGGAGHGCGHQLLGVGAVAAGIAVKDWLVATGRPGTIRVYGTPAEEGGGGKVYQARDGFYADVDIVLHWHPGDRNTARAYTTLANISAKFRFHGVSSHAAAAPERGRSALDAVQAMNHMVDMLREHVPQETRIHYVITNGGLAPNVVPAEAEVYYYARHPVMPILDGIWARIVNAAKGAALGTDTTVDFEVTGGVYDILPNQYLASLQQKSLERAGGVVYSPDERAFAEAIRATLPKDPATTWAALGDEARVDPWSPEVLAGAASTDVGDVSWNVPTAGVGAACYVPGTPAHSWQAVAAGGTTIGTKGLMVAAKTLALTAAELFRNPSHVARAREEFDRRRAGHVYKARVGDRPPPLDYRK